jgi:hypothetical protein
MINMLKTYNVTICFQDKNHHAENKKLEEFEVHIMEFISKTLNRNQIPVNY